MRHFRVDSKWIAKKSTKGDFSFACINILVHLQFWRHLKHTDKVLIHSLLLNVIFFGK